MPQTFSIRDAPTGRDLKVIIEAKRDFSRQWNYFSSQYVLAIDLGTTSVKAALVNCETKDVVGPVAENSQVLTHKLPVLKINLVLCQGYIGQPPP